MACVCNLAGGSKQQQQQLLFVCRPLTLFSYYACAAALVFLQYSVITWRAWRPGGLAAWPGHMAALLSWCFK